MDGSNMQECIDIEESQKDIISLSQTPIITTALALQKPYLPGARGVEEHAVGRRSSLKIV
jgi:hypothetical protein